MSSTTLDRRDDQPTGDVNPYDRATTLIVHGAVLVAGADLALAYGASLTLPLALVLVPLWAPALLRYGLALVIVLLTLATVVSGIVLSGLASVDHDIDPHHRLQHIGLLLSGIGAAALLLWARRELPLHRVVVLYGLGALAGKLVEGQLSWKQHLAVPVTLIVLGLLERGGRRALPAAAVLVLGALIVMDDGRSFLGFCLLAASLTLWQMRPTTDDAVRNRWFPAMLIGTLAVAIYLFATALFTGGYLGSEVQERSVAQIETSGSLIAGGRPEWAATLELVKLQPEGYGVGVVPNWHDVRMARAGLASIDVELEQHREEYMFGGEFKLHSVAADLWVSYGWVGVALAAVIAIALVRSLSFSIAARAAPTSVILVLVIALWHTLFGPIGSNWIDVCAAVGLGLVAREGVRAVGDPPVAHPGWPEPHAATAPVR